MIYRIAADAVLIVHLGFILFVVAGGLACLCRKWWAAIHLPAAAWGAYVELTSRICPLTVWENDLRRLAGEGGFSESFVERYLLPVIYPAGLTQDIQLTLAAFVVIVNLAVYAWVLNRVRIPQA
ncbi:MAG: DUF2784 domain-containing protein [Pseudomonadales bacterium]|nr:DUF2784 domain-containing protein [Pseudomonadales bacterium]MDP6470523.1 DUF2784 domain-containing protein [Pseudomonadales bacterium]MDP6827825.1 DUF2784 domain-containing protein [Pseudomonadales bacterium]MDP6972157.1 DUF2784 domain-containing protein [Pseudomonadales bacterium]